MEIILVPEAGHPAGAQVGRWATSWSDLTPELQERVAQHLPGNEVACSLRQINKAAAELFRGVARVRLSEPVAPHAFVWRWGSPAAYRSLTLKHRRQLMALTAASGILSNLQAAVAAAGCWPDRTAFISAASAGHLSVCEWLPKPEYQTCVCAFEAAAGNGHIALVRGFRSRWRYADAVVWRGASCAGRRDVCEALLADAGPTFVVPLSAILNAARNGHLDLVQWLLRLPQLQKHWQEDKGFAVWLLRVAAHGCNLAGLQCVHDTLVQGGGLPLQSYRDGHLLAAVTSPTPDWRGKVDWLLARGCALDDRSASAFSVFMLPKALQPSDLIERARLFVQLLPEGVRAMDATIRALLENGLRRAAPELVDFALEQCPVAKRADMACWVAEYWVETPAHVTVAARLAARGVPIWPRVIRSAISTGNLQVLQWMAAGAEADGPEGAAVDESPMAQLEGLAGAGPEVRAAAGAALRAALEEWGADLVSLAACTGNLEMMQWLRSQGGALDQGAFTEAARVGNVALLEWMVEEGCPLPTDGNCYELAIINQDMAVLQCLRRLGLPWGPRERELLGCAVENGCRVELLAWLLEAGCAVDWEAARQAASVPGCTPGVRSFIEQSAP